MGNYKRPRELTWVGGALLFSVTIAFGLAAISLPWTQLRLLGDHGGDFHPDAVPVVGDFVARILRGGDQVTGATLSRFLCFPCIDPPALFLLLAGFHSSWSSGSASRRRPSACRPRRNGHGPNITRRAMWTAIRTISRFFQMDMLMVMVYLAVMFFLITFLPTSSSCGCHDTRGHPSRHRSASVRNGTSSRNISCSKIIPEQVLGIIIQLVLFALFLLWPFFDTEKEKNIMKRPCCASSSSLPSSCG